MAIDLTTGGIPAFGTDSAVGTTCVQIRVPPYHRVNIVADVAIYVFNGVDEGDSVPAAANRWALSASEAAQGISPRAGAAVRAARYATVCVAAQSGTAVVRAYVEYEPQVL